MVVIEGISYVARCPYCNSTDWDTPKRKSDGAVCSHPTRVRFYRPEKRAPLKHRIVRWLDNMSRRLTGGPKCD
jgi:hypothetical protein